MGNEEASLAQRVVQVAVAGSIPFEPKKETLAECAKRAQHSQHRSEICNSIGSF
jgi:hypothetical protein